MFDDPPGDLRSEAERLGTVKEVFLPPRRWPYTLLVVVAAVFLLMLGLATTGFGAGDFAGFWRAEGARWHRAFFLVAGPVEAAAGAWLLGRLWTRRGLCVVICEGGFVHRVAGRVSAWPWSEIETVSAKAAFGGHAFCVQKRDGSGIVFSHEDWEGEIGPLEETILEYLHKCRA